MQGRLTRKLTSEKILRFYNWLAPSSHQLKLATYCIYYTRVGMPPELASLLAQQPPSTKTSLFWPQILGTCKKSFCALKQGQAQNVTESENTATDLTMHCIMIWYSHFPFTTRKMLLQQLFHKVNLHDVPLKTILAGWNLFAGLSLKKICYTCQEKSKYYYFNIPLML